ncbi:hypothetical protein EJ110_NYTH50906 [Nymphaea thermarum]|nr:hypothetical protein EJ110_NYTH50906 [Nymphaea thermarum]
MANSWWIIALFISATTSVAAASYAATAEDYLYVKNACASTLYPSLCFSSLSSHADRIRRNPRNLVGVAISVTLSSVTDAAIYMLSMRQTSGGNAEKLALSDCTKMLADAASQMRASMKELKALKRQTLRWQLSNVQTWMSAALTNEGTCTDGFDGLDEAVGGAVSGKIGCVTEMTSNALALANYFASQAKTQL